VRWLRRSTAHAHAILDDVARAANLHDGARPPPPAED
jgi:hypothetical protein